VNNRSLVAVTRIHNRHASIQEIAMNAKLTSQPASETLNVAVAGGGTVELVAVLTAMVFVACGAAALLLTTPSALESVANAAPTEIAQQVSERPFHERYQISAGAGSIDAPTF
jgi:hypothetical protein